MRIPACFGKAFAIPLAIPHHFSQGFHDLNLIEQKTTRGRGQGTGDLTACAIDLTIAINRLRQFIANEGNFREKGPLGIHRSTYIMTPARLL